MTVCPISVVTSVDVRIMRRQGTIDSELSVDLEHEERPHGEVVEDKAGGGPNVQAQTEAGVCDWSQEAVPDNHMWLPSSSGVEVCYLGQDCSIGMATVTSGGPGARLKCVACKVVSHNVCQERIVERLACKRTFVEGVRNYRDVLGCW